ncbi:hypothetical protein KC850_02730 [Candidatus Kaiserbacteria bacterium]|nr:hypothetical protein [Candidatus Kaiserbacteria bacterium]MCB9817935.1 hypothetical protein [Candidatus Nomurabacteria bacterium]
MPSFLHNKYIRFAGTGILILVGIFVVFVVLASLNSARSTIGMSGDSLPYNTLSPSFSPPVEMNAYRANTEMATDGLSYYPPQPNTGNYTADLENFETTTYNITGKTRQFDEVCAVIKNLKNDDEIHFKNLNESTNSCSSVFFVEENKSEEILSLINSYKGVEYLRRTSSVTRYKQQLQSQTDILQQQLGNVQKSLYTAETQLNNLTNFYLTSEDVGTLSKRVNESLQLIDQLTQRKININRQLDSLFQQSADLEARMGVVEFSVNINRSNPIYPNKNSNKWERAWGELNETFTDTLIGLTAFFGIFLLWVFRLTIYGIVLLIVMRAIWKLIKFLWTK